MNYNSKKWLNEKKAARDVLIISPQWEELDPVEWEHHSRSNRAMVVAVTAALMHHIDTNVAEVKLNSWQTSLQSMVARARYVQHSKAT